MQQYNNKIWNLLNIVNTIFLVKFYKKKYLFLINNIYYNILMQKKLRIFNIIFKFLILSN